MNAPLRTPLGKSSPRDLRDDKRQSDFICDCGEEWMTPGHMFWLCRMYCEKCGEVVEAR